MQLSIKVFLSRLISRRAASTIAKKLIGYKLKVLEKFPSLLLRR